MFFSADLLSKRSPLGAIWMVAHGKKLSKGKLMGISLQEICEEVLHPDVPHSLRLQGILVGGVVVVFSKQQNYLWEDVQEMMRRVKEAMNAQPAANAKATLKNGKQKKHQSATLLDDAEEDLMLDGLNNAMTQAAAPQLGFAGLTQRHHLGSWPMDLTQMQDADLFAAAISGRTQSGFSGGSGLGQQRAAVAPLTRRLGSRSASEEDPNELFAVPDEDLLFADELAAGLVHGIVDEATEEHMNDIADVHQADAARQASKGSSKNTSSKGRSLSRPPSAAEPYAPPVDNTDPLDPSHTHDTLLDDPYNVPMEHQHMDDERFDEHEELLTEEEQQKLSEARARAAAELRQTFDEHDREVLTTEDEAVPDTDAQPVKGAKGVKRGRAAAKGKQAKVGKRKARLMDLPMDEPEDVVVPAKEFREWTVNTSDLLKPKKLRMTATYATAAGTGRVNNAKGGDTSESMLSAIAAAGGLLPLGRRDTLPAALRGVSAPIEIHYISELGLADSLVKLRDSCFKRAVKPTIAVVLPLEPAKPKAKRARTQRNNQGNENTRGEAAGDVPGVDGDMLPLYEEEELEMHDQLHELPFGGDIEVERLRAASESPVVGGRRTGSDLGSGAAQLLEQGMDTGHKQGSAMTTSTNRDSAPLGGVPFRVREASVGTGDSGLLHINDDSRPGSAYRLTGTLRDSRDGSESGLLRWGNATLEDLMPDLGGMGQCDLTLRADTGSGGESLPGFGSSRLNEFAASDGTTTGDNTMGPPGGRSADGSINAWETGRLLETSADGRDPSQGATPLTSQASVTVVRLVQHMLREQKASGVAEPAVSFMELAQRLTRKEAVKLFMQVLVTHTASYTKASQSEAYGDILIRAGKRLQV